MKPEKIVNIRFIGKHSTGDIEVDTKDHLFFANGIVVSNCKSHAISYGAITTMELWLKHNYPLQFITSLINNTKMGKKKHGSDNILVDYINYARRLGYQVLPPDINLSRDEFTIEGRAIRFSLGRVKNVAKSARSMVRFQPFSSLSDFYDRVRIGSEQDEDELENAEEANVKKSALRRPNKRVMESLIASGAFDCFGTRNQVYTEYYKLRKSKELPEDKTDDQWDEMETEVLGLCLSKPLLYKEYAKDIEENDWKLISDMGKEKKVVVFGQVTSIENHTSKAGNSMHIIHISDGLDNLRFFVFQGGWDRFKDKYKNGTIGAFPLSRFDGEDAMRFFDEKGERFVLK